LNNLIADIQEEYMPSYPPMSPVTSAFFAGWLVLDARDDSTGMTVGEVFVHYLQHVGTFDYVEKAMVALNDSFCSFYEVRDVGAQGFTLWDIDGKQEVRCWCSSGYAGRKGEIWYVRVLPPFVEADGHVPGCAGGRAEVHDVAASEGSRCWKERVLVGGEWIDGYGPGQPVQ
jgi:hypothetical protein